MKKIGSQYREDAMRKEEFRVGEWKGSNLDFEGFEKANEMTVDATENSPKRNTGTEADVTLAGSLESALDHPLIS